MFRRCRCEMIYTIESSVVRLQQIHAAWCYCADICKFHNRVLPIQILPVFFQTAYTLLFYIFFKIFQSLFNFTGMLFKGCPSFSFKFMKLCFFGFQSGLIRLSSPAFLILKTSLPSSVTTSRYSFSINLSRATSASS